MLWFLLVGFRLLAGMGRGCSICLQRNSVFEFIAVADTAEETL